jgi:hypothetical protein
MKPTDPPPHPPSQNASARQGSPSSARHAPPDIPHHHTPEELHNVDVAHEHVDVNVRAILLFAVGLVVVAVISALAMVVLFRVFENMAAANDPKLSPLATPSTDMPKRTSESPYFGAAPQPQLITNEPAVLQQLRQNETEQMHGYGWVDQPAGVARIPIEDAKKLILERGLPVRAGSSSDPTLGTTAPAYGEGSSGRTIPTGSSQSAASREAAPPKEPGAPKQVPQ